MHWIQLGEEEFLNLAAVNYVDRRKSGMLAVFFVGNERGDPDLELKGDQADTLVAALNGLRQNLVGVQ